MLKKTSQSLGKGDYQCPPCECTCQIRIILFETNLIILMGKQGIYFFEETQKSVQDVIGEVYCPGKCCLRQKCVCVQTWK